MEKINNTNLFLTAVPHISFYSDVNINTLIIFHKEQNSLLKIDLPISYTINEISNAITKAMGNLDWDKTFDEVFSKVEYRNAVMQVPNILIGE